MDDESQPRVPLPLRPTTVARSPEMVPEQAVDVGGSGDNLGTRRRLHRHADIPRRRNINGLVIPTFEAEEGDILLIPHPPPRFAQESPSSGLFQALELDSTRVAKLLDLLQCPICLDHMAEGSCTQCGHAYCKNCIRAWIRIKPLCPICSSAITSTCHAFWIDRLIDIFQGTGIFSDHFRRKHQAAILARLARKAAQEDLGLVRVLKRYWNTLQNGVQNVRIKGIPNLLREAIQHRREQERFDERNDEGTSTRLRPGFFDMKSAIPIILGVLMGMVIMQVLLSLPTIEETMHVLRYLYLCYRQYDHKSPLLDPTTEAIPSYSQDLKDNPAVEMKPKSNFFNWVWG